MTTRKPIILDEAGIFSQLADGEIINAGGTDQTTWTVDGRGLLFDDGTSTSGGGSLTLQQVYSNSSNLAGEAKIKLITGKDFVITDDTDDLLYFRIDSETGKITITGDLEVLGSSTIIDTVIQDSDHWQITPKLGTTSALRIEPDIGVVPIVDLVTVRTSFGGAPAFRIDAGGNLILTQNLTVGGQINGVDIVDLKNDVDRHALGTVGYRHKADEVDIDPIASIPLATNVQEALADINTKVDSIVGGGGGGTVYGYEHIQNAPATIWTAVHGGGSFRTQVTIYDTNWEQVLPEDVKVIDNNTVRVTFASAMAGRAMILLF